MGLCRLKKSVDVQRYFFLKINKYKQFIMLIKIIKASLILKHYLFTILGI